MMLRIPGWFEDDDLRAMVDSDIAAAYDRQWAEDEEPDPELEPEDEAAGELAALSTDSGSGGRRRRPQLLGGRSERRSA